MTVKTKVSEEFKGRIVAAIRKDSERYDNQTQHATSLGINNSVLSRLLSTDEWDGLLSDKNWMLVANRLEVRINPEDAQWHVARTKVFEAVYRQLEMCQKRSVSGILCDSADIGKSFTAKCYVREKRNAYYIDCSQSKTKRRLVEQIAREIGIDYGGTYANLYEDLIECLRFINRPLIILDEVGDLSYEAFLEVKALWNATERTCGWYMMGADGLRAKFEANLQRRKVGYAELFSRFGSKYQRITPAGKEEMEDFKRSQFAEITKVNAPDADVAKLYASTNGSLRRIYTALAIAEEKRKEQVNG